MCRYAFLVFAVACVVFLPVSLSQAQNLLVNPDFDTDLSGWSGIGFWSSLDAWGSSNSGSATWINNFPAGGATVVDQCVELEPFFEGFDLSG